MRTARLFCLLLACVAMLGTLKSQTYQLDLKLDAPLLAGTFGLALGTTLAQPSVDPLDAGQISSLNRSDVNRFDRPATYNWSPKAGQISDAGIFIGFAAPVAGLAFKNGRSEALKIAVMLMEGGFGTVGLTYLTKTTVLRTRPYVYNSLAPFSEKNDVDARFSFFSGHTSTTSYGVFFAAKVLHDLNPDAKWRPATWAAAAAIAGTTGYLRVRAGRHFPTDVLAGMAVGAGMGILIPQIHKSKSMDLSLYPVPQGIGAVLSF